MKSIFLQFKKSLLLISIIILGFPNINKASGLIGGDISYQCTSASGIYKVSLKLYRDCSGLPFCMGCFNAIPNGNVTGCTTASAGFTTKITGLSPGFAGINYGSFVLTAVASNNGYDIIQTCSSMSSICTNCNTRTAGSYSPGIEVYTFEGNVDLSTIPTASCKIALQADNCCRSEALQTVVPGSYFMIAELDRCQSTCNSAPIFTNDAVVAVCSAVDFVYNLGAIDFDGDSLSYDFGASYSALNTQVSYIEPFSSNYFVQYFGAPNKNAAYPAGLRIDPITGDIMFRPNSALVTYLVIEVTQWKLVNGVRVNVGKTRRDVEFRSVLCNSVSQANRSPILKTYKNGVLPMDYQNFVAYAGEQFCIDIVAQDRENTPLLADTTDLSWNNPGLVDNAMNNATFTRNYILANRGMNGPKADSFKFCWTPPVTAIRNQPHLFTITGSDRFCPLKGSFTRGINIKVEASTLSIPTTLLENDLNVFPNPTKTNITITNKTNLVGKKYIITNLVGQTVLSGKLNLDETIVNLENLQSGIYLLSIDGLNKQSIKVIKE